MFKEPVLCQIDSIVYEFPSALTIAYLKKNDMEVEERIIQRIVLKIQNQVIKDEWIQIAILSVDPVLTATFLIPQT